MKLLAGINEQGLIKPATNEINEIRLVDLWYIMPIMKIYIFSLRGLREKRLKQ